MNKKILWVFVCCLLTLTLVVWSCDGAPSSEQEEEEEEQPTEITTSGWIYEDETWSGIVHITGDVWVDETVTLTILPGTEVLFSSTGDDQNAGVAAPMTSPNDPTWTLEYAQNHCKLDVYGTLIAKGTQDNMIVFTSDNPNPDAADWTHLHIGHSSVIEYCIIEYSRGGIDVRDNTGDSVIITHNIIRHNLWTGIDAHKSSPTVTFNEIYHSGGHQGIAAGWGTALIANNLISDCKLGIVMATTNSVVIENNTIVNNDNGIVIQGSPYIHNNVIKSPNGAQYDFTYQGEAIYFAHTNQGQYDDVTGIIVRNCSSTITNNEISLCPLLMEVTGTVSLNINNSTFSEGTIGILFGPSFDGSVVLNNNNFYDNHIHIGLEPGFDGIIDATYNWWGTTDLSELIDLIRDSHHDPSRGTVLYEPLLLAPAKID